MAPTPPALSRPMHGQGHTAIGTLEGVAALAAEHRGGIAAAIEQYEHLLAPVEPLLERGGKCAADHHVRPGVGIFLPHVDDSNRRQRAVAHAARERHMRVLAGERMLIALHRWGRGPQHHEGPERLPANNRHISAVIARRLLLLVGGVVLLVHDNQAKVAERSEHRGASTDHHVDATVADTLPLVVPFPIGKPAVLNRDPRAKRRSEQRDHRRCQGNLRHQQQHLLPSPADAISQAEIDFRLAATGHAVQQRDPKTARIQHTSQSVNGDLLLGGQQSVGVTRDIHTRRALERVPLVAIITRRDQTTGTEAAKHISRRALLPQRSDGESCGDRGQDLQDAALSGREAHPLLAGARVER